MNQIKLLILAVTLATFSYTHAQLTDEQWRDDLGYLRKEIYTNYPFLFKKITREKWDMMADRLHQSLPEMEHHQAAVGFARLISAFGYGHTSVGLSSVKKRFGTFPYRLYWFKDGLYVQGVHKDFSQALGAKVLAFDDTPTDSALAKIKPVVPSENDQFFKAYGMDELSVPEILHAQNVMGQLNSKITLTLCKGNAEFKVTFTAIDSGPPLKYGFVQSKNDWMDALSPGTTPQFLKDLDKTFTMEYLQTNKTLYVRHSGITNMPEKSIEQFYNEVFSYIDSHDVQRLIIDLRLNGGGNNYLNKPIVTGIIANSKINVPGKFIAIIGRRSFSACQNLVNELDNYTNVIFVGEPTAENINFYGDTKKVILPNSQISVFLSFAWWQDKPQWENDQWTSPDIAVEMTSDDYINGRDPVLTEAISLSSDHLVVNPRATLLKWFSQGMGIEEAKSIVKDEKFKYLSLESTFNRAGYAFASEGNLDQALYTMKLNAQLFPDSPNVWDSLGDITLKNGDKEKARTAFQKAVQLDPEGAVGNHARTALSNLDR